MHHLNLIEKDGGTNNGQVRCGAILEVWNVCLKLVGCLCFFGELFVEVSKSFVVAMLVRGGGYTWRGWMGLRRS